MKCLDPETESAVRDFLSRIPADIQVERAILYGSRARGEHRPDSDADMARATLLRTDFTEDKLPRTHGGVSNHAIQSGRIDQELATQLSRTEALRIMADYTDTDIDENLEPVYLEDFRRQARANWLTLQRQRAGIAR